MTYHDEDAPARPIWLMTLADLSLLLVGFFVFLQATQVDPKILAASFRAGFGIKEAAATTQAMPVDIAAATGFAPGSAQAGDLSGVIGWARTAAVDPRTRLRITGETQGDGDVDPATGSAAILAADRARAIASALVRTGAVPASRVQIATGTGQRRALLTIGFDGDGK